MHWRRHVTTHCAPAGRSHLLSSRPGPIPVENTCHFCHMLRATNGDMEVQSSLFLNVHKWGCTCSHRLGREAEVRRRTLSRSYDKGNEAFCLKVGSNKVVQGARQEARPDEVDAGDFGNRVGSRSGHRRYEQEERDCEQQYRCWWRGWHSLKKVIIRLCPSTSERCSVLTRMR